MANDEALLNEVIQAFADAQYMDEDARAQGKGPAERQSAGALLKRCLEERGLEIVRVAPK